MKIVDITRRSACKYGIYSINSRLTIYPCCFTQRLLFIILVCTAHSMEENLFWDASNLYRLGPDGLDHSMVVMTLNSIELKLYEIM